MPKESDQIAMPEPKYVVTVVRCYRGSPEMFDEYLEAIRYDRYQTGNNNVHASTTDLVDAFHFRTLEAAEMAAAFVGGEVLPISQAVEKTHDRA